MESNYFEYSVSKTDRLINRFVRLALLIRGSSRLFSNEKSAEKYLEKVKDKSFSLDTGGRYPCRVSKLTVCGLECAVFEPFEAKSEVRVVFFHGGAYVRRITKHHLRALASLCAKSKAEIIAPCYPTAPKYTFSESIRQLAELYRNVCADGKRIVLSGDSCGGAISVCLLDEIKRNNFPKVEKLILFSPLLSHNISGDSETESISNSDPMFGGTEGLKTFIERWSGSNKFSDPINTDFSLLPPTYIFTSSNDMLSVGCRRFYEKAGLFSADVTVESYDGMFHDFILYPLPCSKQLLKKAAALINE